MKISFSKIFWPALTLIAAMAVCGFTWSACVDGHYEWLWVFSLAGVCWAFQAINPRLLTWPMRVLGIRLIKTANRIDEQRTAAAKKPRAWTWTTIPGPF